MAGPCPLQRLRENPPWTLPASGGSQQSLVFPGSDTSLHFWVTRQHLAAHSKGALAHLQLLYPWWALGGSEQQTADLVPAPRVLTGAEGGRNCPQRSGRPRVVSPSVGRHPNTVPTQPSPFETNSGIVVCINPAAAASAGPGTVEGAPSGLRQEEGEAGGNSSNSPVPWSCPGQNPPPGRKRAFLQNS